MAVFFSTDFTWPTTAGVYYHATDTTSGGYYFRAAPPSDPKPLSRLERDRGLLVRLRPSTARRPPETSLYAPPGRVSSTAAVATPRPHRLRRGSRRLAR